MGERIDPEILAIAKSLGMDDLLSPKSLTVAKAKARPPIRTQKADLIPPQPKPFSQGIDLGAKDVSLGRVNGDKLYRGRNSGLRRGH